MKNLIDGIIDFIYKFAKILFLLLILFATTFFVYRTINHMFNKNYQESSTYSKELNIKQITDEVKNIEITIPPEAKDLDVSKILISGNIIKDENEFLNYLKENKITSFKSGNFKLNKDMPIEQIANTIKK